MQDGTKPTVNDPYHSFLISNKFNIKMFKLLRATFGKRFNCKKIKTRKVKVHYI